MAIAGPRPKVLVWHIHSSYLIYLTQAHCDFYLPVLPNRAGYQGRSNGIWGDNVIDVPASEVKNLDLDCVIFQNPDNYLVDQFEILSPEQRLLPQIYVEHNPPRDNPANSRHIFDNPDGLLVHVTHFNRLMWDNGNTPTTVIPHGVFLYRPGPPYSGELAQGITVFNDMVSRGRVGGLDIFLRVREVVPLEIIGFNAGQLGGREAIHIFDLPALLYRYRFFFYPVRYTSLGLAVCEAMLMGLPVVGLATTELATTIENAVTGYVSNDVDWLIERMQALLADRALAQRLGKNAQAYAREHFDIGRFASQWEETIRARQLA